MKLKPQVSSSGTFAPPSVGRVAPQLAVAPAVVWLRATMLAITWELAVACTWRPPTARTPPVLSAIVDRSTVSRPWLVETMPPAAPMAPVLSKIVESAICVRVNGVISAPPMLSTPPPALVSIKLWPIARRPPARFATPPPPLDPVTRTLSSVVIPWLTMPPP